MKRLVLLLLMCSLLAVTGQSTANQEGFTEEDAVLADACPDQSDSVTVCLTNKVCFNFPDKYQWPTNGACPEGWTLQVIGNVTDACKAAAAIANPDPCARTCQDNGIATTRNQNANCCTVTEVRQCDPWPQDAGN